MTTVKSNSKSFMYTGNNGVHNMYVYTYNNSISINLYSAIDIDEESYVTVTHSCWVLNAIEEMVAIDEWLITPDMAYKYGQTFILEELIERLD